MIDVTPDAVPVIGEVPGARLLPRFRLFRPRLRDRSGAGRLTADLVAGDTPVVDPAPFRFERFS